VKYLPVCKTLQEKRISVYGDFYLWQRNLVRWSVCLPKIKKIPLSQSVKKAQPQLIAEIEFV